VARNRLKLAPVELMLMKSVWRLGEATVQQVRDDVASERDLAYTTVLTMLRTLEQKGFLTHEERGRRYVYRPLVSEEQVGTGMLHDLLQRVFDGSPERLLTRLLEVRRLDEEELRAMKEIIRRGEEGDMPEDPRDE
jgi:predicted transcriptional regulator